MTGMLDALLGAGPVTTVLVAMVTGLVAYWLVRRWKYNFPPSPAISWPVVGHTLSESFLFDFMPIVTPRLFPCFWKMLFSRNGRGVPIYFMQFYGSFVAKPLGVGGGEGVLWAFRVGFVRKPVAKRFVTRNSYVKEVELEWLNNKTRVGM